MKKLLTISLVLFALSIVAAAQDQMSSLKIVVVKATNGKPVRNASVVLHMLDKDGQQGSGGINLKTDPEGKTGFEGIPFGKLRVQVIARGFQTYGEDIDINQAQQELTIKMEPPAGQYSIYGNEKKN